MLLSFFGAAPDTGNLGVSALCYATLISIVKQQPDAEITVFDCGRGRCRQSIQFNETEVSFYRQGAVNTRRFYRPESLWVMKFLGMFGGLGNPGIQTICASNAILDISGGDSFTDLYGARRFDSVTLPKLIAIQQKKPLILLPQTYGPFATQKCRQIASGIVKKARCAWARDARSFQVLRELLGSSFDPGRHKCGVDVAFGLPAVKPANLPPVLEDFFADKDNEKIGINISGLIYNDPLSARKRFGFKADYNKTVLELTRRFLKQTSCRIALIPHVVTPVGHYESDIEACRDVLMNFGNDAEERVFIVPAYDNPCEIKWVVSKLNWFCGTRMHAAIAALSSGVPVSAISYSPKTLGVFETCGQGKHVADPQKMDQGELLNCLWQSWIEREKAIAQYAEKLPGVKAQVEEQTRVVLNAVKN